MATERVRAWRIRPHRKAYESLWACIVSLYWAWGRGCETETCQRCGKPNGRLIGSWWAATDADWISVMGHLGGAMCPKCFVDAWRSEHPGELIYWQAVPERSRDAVLDALSRVVPLVGVEEGAHDE